jgi:hypothetical protein
MQIGLGFMASKTLLTAVELGLFTKLADAPATADEIRQTLGLHPRGVSDFLDTLVSLKFLDRTDGVYSNTGASEMFLDRKKPSYVGGMLEMANARLWDAWSHLTTALRTGQPQNEIALTGESTFEALYANPERLKTFLAAMTGISLGSARAIAQKFPWSNYKTFIDVGCAQGGLPVQVALANPHLRGAGFDLEQVRPIFEEYVSSFGLSERLTFKAGDFFTQQLPTADVLIMGHILHDWNMDEKRMLLRKAYDALPAGGALIVFEALIDDDRRTNTGGLLMSLNMLIETPGGFDYTGAECSEWMREAGFRDTRVEHLTGPDSMVIALK